jgi:NitT/TauT family transport system substrate-binding protein
MPATLKKITTEHSGTVFTLPYLVARDEGYFADEGLEVEFVRRRGDSRPARNIVTDHHQVDSFGVSFFEKGEAALYRACEWGQVRRSADSAVGGRIISKRSAVAVQAIVVRPDSPVTHPQDLRNKTVGVSFHHGSHYITIQMLEGFLNRDEINVVHVNGSRFEALRDGEVDAVTVMEPWITVAEKLGYKLIAEAFYVGSEIASDALDPDTFAAINRAVSRAARKLTEDPRPYLHYLIEDVPADIVQLTPADFRLSRFRYVDPAPYGELEFQRTYDWMVSWGLIAPDQSFEQLVDNRVAVGV